MTVLPSQILILAAIIVFGLYVFVARTVLVDRMIYLVLVGTGILLGLHPDLSTRAANLIGIGRGADLLLYVFVLFSLFHYASIASHQKEIERQITALVRSNAIDHPVAAGPGGHPPGIAAEAPGDPKTQE